MSLQWTLVATFLYFEVGLVFILLLPFISPTRWQKIFRSRLIQGLASYASIYFNVILVALVLLLLDAIREIVKYKSRIHTAHDASHAGLHYGPTVEQSKEFRAQRNFYISGTALFLWFVFRRLLALISNAAHLIAEAKASKSQAESATLTAQTLINEAKEKTESNEKQQIDEEDLNELKTKLREREEEVINLGSKLKSAEASVEAIKKQSEGLTNEYDNLLKLNEDLTNKLRKFENAGENKKED